MDMANLLGWRNWAGVLMNETPKNPWGSGSGGGDKDSAADKGGSSGPRNPWSFPPDSQRPRSGASGPLEDLLRRARVGGGGGGGGAGPALPGIPQGSRFWGTVVGALLLGWILFTSIHSVGPQERGVVMTLGRFSGTLEPGWRFTLPAPLSLVEVIDVQAIRDEKFPDTDRENLMLTGDQNIVDLAYLVQWKVRSAPDYIFQVADPRNTVRDTAETAMRAVVANATLNDTITSGRARIEAQVIETMQKILDEYNSGIIVQSVSIQKAAAPQAVDEEFKQVTAAQQQAQANRNNANAWAQQQLATAQGEAAEFDKIYEQYKLAPEVTRRRLYYETMEQVLGKTNKTIVEAPGVTPYLPLPGLARKGAEPADKPAQGATK